MTLQSVSGLVEPEARAVTTIALRSIGLALLGCFVAFACCSIRLQWAYLAAIFAAPLVTTVSLWINLGYFPIWAQLWLAIISGVIGGLIGLGLLRSRIALAIALLFAIGVFAWGTATGISDDLEKAAAATIVHLLGQADRFPAGDEGFAAIIREAFEFAHDNSHRQDPKFANKVAVLSLGVLIGDEAVAKVARRPIPEKYKAELAAFRSQITLRGRADLPRHFFVSAALAVLSDANRSLTVGIAKELMDATPGGSGFSFVDLTADRAGILFAIGATSTDESAAELQDRIRDGLRAEDLCPPIDGLPEGLTAEQFREQFGGLGGVESTSVVKDIQSRLSQCAGLIVP